jgi:2-hydroxycyclohexanecarboxyl-CoA dehydrogenase
MTTKVIQTLPCETHQEHAVSKDKLKGRRALVTGGAQGIGAAIVRRLCAEGAAVLILDVDISSAQSLVSETGASAARVDVTDAFQVNETIRQHGPFDILINNAGVDQHTFFTKSQPEEWARLMAVNLQAVFLTTHAVLPAMQAQGFGRIVNIASEAGRLGSRGGSVYAAAKGGVISFTRSIARESSSFGVTANVVAPGPIDTPMLRAAVAQGGERLLEAMVSATLVKRLGSPEEVAATVAFLVSDEAGFITGETLGVSGGMGCGQ